MKKLIAGLFLAIALLFAAPSAKAQFNLYDPNAVVTLVTNAAITATTTNAVFDTLGYIGEGILVLNWSQSAGTNATLDVAIRHCPTSNGTFTNLASGAFTQVTNALYGSADIQKLRISLPTTHRYVRVVQTVAGTEPTFTTSVNMIARRKYN